jgi:DNA-binding response OmpR family regulator
VTNHAGAPTGSGGRPFRATRPDLTVTNLSLPGFDGVQVCRLLRAAPGTGHIPVLMLSVHQHPDDAAARAAGADDHLGKPFANRDLLDRAEALLNRDDDRGMPATLPKTS